MRYLLLFVSLLATIPIGLFSWLASHLILNASQKWFASVTLIYCIGFGVFTLFACIVRIPNWLQGVGLAGLAVTTTLMFL
jgi:hypothetical protein